MNIKILLVLFVNVLEALNEEYQPGGRNSEPPNEHVFPSWSKASSKSFPQSPISPKSPKSAGLQLPNDSIGNNRVKGSLDINKQSKNKYRDNHLLTNNTGGPFFKRRNFAKRLWKWSQNHQKHRNSRTYDDDDKSYSYKWNNICPATVYKWGKRFSLPDGAPLQTAAPDLNTPHACCKYCGESKIGSPLVDCRAWSFERTSKRCYLSQVSFTDWTVDENWVGGILYHTEKSPCIHDDDHGQCWDSGNKNNVKHLPCNQLYSYLGKRDKTVDGIPCQAWQDQTPHRHPGQTREDGFQKNYCRQTGTLDPFGPWCYTTDPKVRWAYCFPHCIHEDSKCLLTHNGNQCWIAQKLQLEKTKVDCQKPFTYNGTKSTTKYGETCQDWGAQSPHAHNYGNLSAKGWRNNYCRQDSADFGPWCYTTGSRVWAYCFKTCNEVKWACPTKIVKDITVKFSDMLCAPHNGNSFSDGLQKPDSEMCCEACHFLKGCIMWSFNKETLMCKRFDNRALWLSEDEMSIPNSTWDSGKIPERYGIATKPPVKCNACAPNYCCEDKKPDSTSELCIGDSADQITSQEKDRYLLRVKGDPEMLKDQPSDH